MKSVGLLWIASTWIPCFCLAQSSYTISTVAGGNPLITGIGDGRQATSAFLNSPAGVAVDAAGNLYIADTNDQLIRKVSANGVISTFAGTNGISGFTGDSGPATSARLHTPTGVAVDTAGNVYIADTANNRIRKVSTGGVITTVAGSSNVFSNGVGDGGPATSASLNFPRAVLPDAAGNLYICDYGNARLRKVATNGTITTVAGNGSNYNVAGSLGDGGPATSAVVSPAAAAIDSAGNIFIADPADNLIRRVSTSGTITTVAGDQYPLYTGDGGQATLAALNSPMGVLVDTAGNIFIADTGNAVIRLVTSAGIISTVAGTGGIGSAGDGGAATSATLNNPTSIAFGNGGSIYIADSSSTGYADDRIRLLTLMSGSAPAIASGGVVPIYSSANTIQPGSWISIFGTNLAPATATWNGDFPIALGQVTVTIDSRPAYLWYVSPTQLNIQAPDDTNRGSVSVVVTTPGGSTTSSVTLAAYAPSFSLLTSRYPIAIVLTPGAAGNSGAGYDVIGPVGAFSYPTRPARAGETVILFGVGFGPVTPSAVAGQLLSAASTAVSPPQISIGGSSATVSYAGLVEAGLFQFNVVVPAASSGDQPLLASIGGASAQANLFLTVQ